jgi:hypothetical protein
MVLFLTVSSWVLVHQTTERQGTHRVWPDRRFPDTWPIGPEIGGAQFHYRIDGDELHMEPVKVGTCPPGGAWCEAAWELMVAMPGMAWHREPQQRF